MPIAFAAHGAPASRDRRTERRASWVSVGRGDAAPGRNPGRQPPLADARPDHRRDRPPTAPLRSLRLPGRALPPPAPGAAGPRAREALSSNSRLARSPWAARRTANSTTAHGCRSSTCTQTPTSRSFSSRFRAASRRSSSISGGCWPCSPTRGAFVLGTGVLVHNPPPGGLRRRPRASTRVGERIPTPGARTCFAGVTSIALVQFRVRAPELGDGAPHGGAFSSLAHRRVGAASTRSRAVSFPAIGFEYSSLSRRCVQFG